MPINKKGLDNIKKLLQDAPGRSLSKPALNDIGENIIKDMKTLIASGKSPIEGKGKFPAYKNPKKYPGSRKSKTPVNLELSGDFLSALSQSNKTGDKPVITIFYSGKEDLKESGHREGVNDQPKRPTIPRGSEQFAQGIRNNILQTAYNYVLLYFSKQK